MEQNKINSSNFETIEGNDQEDNLRVINKYKSNLKKQKSKLIMTYQANFQ